MKVSIRIYYRVVKAVRDNETYFVPQYQEAGDPETTFHNFREQLKGRAGGHNDIYFESEKEAINFIQQEITKDDHVVFGAASDNNYHLYD